MYACLFSPHVLHHRSIFDFIAQCSLVKSTNYEAHHYAKRTCKSLEFHSLDIYFRLKETKLISLLTYSMKHSYSWETNRFSASQEIPRILWNPKVHHRVYNSLPPVLILSQINPVYALHPSAWRSILILSSQRRLVFPTGLFPPGVSTKTP